MPRFAVNRGVDRAVGEVDLGIRELALGGLDGALGLELLGLGRLEIGEGAGLGLVELLLAVVGELGVGEIGLGGVEAALRLFDRGLVLGGINLRDQITLFDHGSFFHRIGGEDSLDLSLEGDIGDGDAVSKSLDGEGHVLSPSHGKR